MSMRPSGRGEVDERHLDENHPSDGAGLAPRVCTDAVCLVVFGAYLVGLCAIAVYAFRNGDPRRLTHGYDYSGRLCGVGAGVEDRPLLYWCGAGHVDSNGIPTALDLNFPVCVSFCPTDTFTGMVCLGKEEVQVEKSGKGAYEFARTVVVQSTVKQNSYPTMEWAGAYCTPHFSAGHIAGDDHLTKSLLGPAGPLGNRYARFASAWGGLRRAWPAVAASLVLALLLGYGYVFLLQRHPRLLMQAIFLGLPFSCFSIGFFFLLGGVLNGGPLQKWEEGNIVYHQYDSDAAVAVTRAFGTGLLLLGMLLLLFAWSAREALETALECVDATCSCITSVRSLLLQPAVEAVWKISIAAFMLTTLVWLLSTAHLTTDFVTVGGVEVGGLTHSFAFSAEGKVMAIAYAFGLAWSMEFCTAMSQFIVSYTVVLWYYIPKPKAAVRISPLVRGLIVGTIFHVGTLAFGSFLAMTLRPLRIVLALLSAHTARLEQENRSGEALTVCLRYCGFLYRRHVQYVGKNAYIDVCISSTGYCVAAVAGVEFVQAEGGKVSGLMGVSTVLSTALVAATAALSGLATLLQVVAVPAWSSEASSRHVADPFFVAGVAAALGGIVAGCFGTVLEHTTDTLLYVYVWNKMHGHNTVQKYAPDALLDLTEYRPMDKFSGEGTGPLTGPRVPARGGMLGVLNSLFANGTKSPRREETHSLMYPPP